MRKNPCREAIENVLNGTEFSYRVESGGKHPRFVIDVNGREETVIFSASPSDFRAPLKASADVRRRVAMWRAEASGVQIEHSPSELEEVDMPDYSEELREIRSLIVEMQAATAAREDLIFEAISRLESRIDFMAQPSSEIAGEGVSAAAVADAATVRLTYDDIGRMFGINAESTRSLVRRKGWERETNGNLPAIISVPVDEIKRRAAHVTFATAPEVDLPDLDSPQKNRQRLPINARLAALVAERRLRRYSA